MFKTRGFERVEHIARNRAFNKFPPVRLPVRKTTGSAGYDFIAPDPVIIRAHSFSRMFGTGVKAYMPQDEVLLLFVRSSLGIKHGLVLANGTGVIDSDYYNNPDNEGNIGCVLYNNSDNDYELKAGERFMQGIFVKYGVSDNGNAEEKRVGGMGSTDKE